MTTVDPALTRNSTELIPAPVFSDRQKSIQHRALCGSTVESQMTPLRASRRGAVRHRPCNARGGA